MLEATSLTDEYNIKNNNLAATLDKIKKKMYGWFSSEGLVAWLTTAVTWFANFIGATEQADKKTSAWKSTLVFTAKMVAVVTAALITNITWLKLAALWTSRGTKGNALYTIGLKARAFAEGVGTVFTQAYAAATMFLTGNMVGATQAFRVMTAAMMTTPWGFIIGAIAAIGTAYVVFSEEARVAATKQSLLNDAIKDSGEAIAVEKVNLEQLLKIARDETQSKKERQKAIDELNKIVPGYNNNLTIESANTLDATNKVNEYVKSIERAARAKYFKSLVDKKAEELIKAENSSLEDNINWLEQTWNAMKTGGQFFAMQNANSKTSLKNKQELIDITKEELKNAEELYLSQLKINNPNEINDLQVLISKKENLLKLEQENLEGIKSKNNLFGGIYSLEKTQSSQKIKSLKEEIKLNKELLNSKIDESEENNNPNGKKPKGEDALSYLKSLEEKLREVNIQRELLVTEDGIKNVSLFEKLTKDAETLNSKIESVKSTLSLKDMNEELSTIAEAKIKFAQLTIKDEEELKLAVLEIRKEQYSKELGMAMKMIMKKEDLTEMDKAMIEESARNERDTINQINELKLNDIRAFETRKRELKNQIDLQNATTEVERDLLKETQDLEKELLALDKLKLSEERKGELKKLIVQKYINDIDKITDEAANKRLQKQLKFDKQEINFEKEKNSLKIDLAQQLGNALLGVLGNSLAGQIGVIALNAIIEIAKLKIATSAAQQINMANAVATLPPPLNAPLIAAATVQNTALGASSKLKQTSIIASAAISGVGAFLSKKSKVKGYEDGLYDIIREQDGKRFNAAYGGQTSSGMVNKPTVFMAGENGPELIIDSAAYKNINPEIKYALHREIARVKGFETGYYPQQTKQPEYSEDSTASLTNNDALLVAALDRNSTILEKLDATGVIAYMSRDLKNAKAIKEDIADYEKLTNKNKV